MLNFEWDDAKAETNSAKHGVTFDDGLEVFADRGHVLAEATSNVELREKAIGRVGDRIIAVIFTRRGSDIRLISARPAKRTERLIYGNRQTHA